MERMEMELIKRNRITGHGTHGIGTHQNVIGLRDMEPDIRTMQRKSSVSIRPRTW